MLAAMRAMLPRQRPTRRKARKVRAARLPVRAASEYLVGLRRLQAVFEAAVRSELYPALERIAARSAYLRPDSAEVRVDAAAEDLDEVMRALRDMLGVGVLFDQTVIESLAARLSVEVSGFQRNELLKQAKRSIGLDLMILEPWLQEHLGLFVQENVGLISSIPSTQLDEVEGLVRRALRSDLRVEQITEQIEARFGVSASRAELIANDQTLKLNGELNKLRQQSIGLDEARWSHSRDERVRKRHRELGQADGGQGQLFRWDDPPVVDSKTGRTAIPGADYRCRCTGIPVFDGLLDDGEG